MHIQKKDHARTEKEGSSLQAQGEASEETEPANTLILDTQPLEL